MHHFFKDIIYYSKYFFFNPSGIVYYRELKKNQNLSSDELNEINWQRRKDLIKHAYETCPFYTSKFDKAGIKPQDISSWEDYQNIPILTREELKVHFEEIISSAVHPKHMRVSTTGGTTGAPVKVLQDSRAHFEPYGWRMLLWWGITPGMDGAFMWRLADKKKTLLWRMKNTLLWWPTVKIRTDASSMTTDNMLEFIKECRVKKPPLLQGYVGALYHLAQYIDENNIDAWRPHAIWGTSSPIKEPQRALIEKVFKAPYYDQYGSCEVTWISAQCEKQEGLHINHEGRFVEFVDDNNNEKPTGETGKILITDLDNYAFPLIRYENGDLGRRIDSLCSCGRALPLMDKVQGRISENVYLPNGTVLSGEYLTTIFDDYAEQINQFQVKQEEDYSLHIYYVPNTAAYGDINIEKKLRNVFKEKTQQTVPVHFHSVNSIADDRGKLRFIISKVNNNA